MTSSAPESESEDVSNNQGEELCNELGAKLKARNKITRGQEIALPCALVKDISDIMDDNNEPLVKPHKHLKDKEQFVSSLLDKVNKIKRLSEREMDFVIDEIKNHDAEISQAISHVRQQSDKLFKRIINTQVGFNECLNSSLMTENPEITNYVNKHAKLIEQTCKYDRGVEALIRCDKEELEKCYKKDLKIETVDEFNIAYNELAEDKLSTVYEHGVKSFKNHEHLLAIKKYNKSTTEMVVGNMETTGRLDPFTLKLIKKPVRNKICKHIYDQESIDKMFQGKLFMSCPLVGCSNKRFTKKDILYNLNSSDDSE